MADSPVAEYQAKVDPDLLAVEAYRIGRVYNDAVVAPEITGGWGFTITNELKRLRYPRLYTRRIRDRLSDRWTDVLGWDTNKKTRMVMLDTLATFDRIVTWLRENGPPPGWQAGAAPTIPVPKGPNERW